uniref:Putative secreted protein n=1 Tax=Amblyomma americanum TaxID=6943 RepID=A0A0C9S483_AMBAM
MNSPALLVVALSVIFMQGSAKEEETLAQEPQENTKGSQVNQLCRVPEGQCRGRPDEGGYIRWYYDARLGICGMYRQGSTCSRTTNDFPTCWKCEEVCFNGLRPEETREFCTNATSNYNKNLQPDD